MANEWYTDALLLRDFAVAAVEAGIADDKVEVFEKPYRFNDEYTVWAENGYPAPEDANWDEFVTNLGLEQSE